MIDNAKIQSALIAKLKTDTDITSVVSSLEIREDSWKGTDFSYPNIRIDLWSLEPKNLSGCGLCSCDGSIIIFSEEKSSQEADVIAGKVANSLRGKSFTYNGIHFSLISIVQVLSARPTEEVWQSEVKIIMLVSETA